MDNKNRTNDPGRGQQGDNTSTNRNENSSQQNAGNLNPQDGSDWNNYRERELSSNAGSKQSEDEVRETFEKGKR